MVTYNKYNIFPEDLMKGVHILHGTAGSGGVHTCFIAMSVTTPNLSTHVVRADITELSTSGGYTSGGKTCANVGSRSSGTFTLVCTDIVWTGSGGGFTFRYLHMFNDTPTSPADPLISEWDFGSSQAVASGDTVTADFGASTFTLV